MSNNPPGQRQQTHVVRLTRWVAERVIRRVALYPHWLVNLPDSQHDGRVS